MEHLNKFLSRLKRPRNVKGESLSEPFQQVRSPRRERVSEVLRLVMAGYRSAMELSIDEFKSQISVLSPIEQNVVFEGAYVALASLDLKESGKLLRSAELFASAQTRVPPFLQGIGGALAHLQIPITIYPKESTEIWGWLALSGYGYFQGYFNWFPTLQNQAIPPGISGLALRAYDQGVGSSIWFVGASNPDLIAHFIREFPEHRQADLWNGVGIAIGVWGLDDTRDLKRILNKAKTFRHHLQSGVAFGVWARHDSKAIDDYTNGASSAICDATPAEIVEIVTGSLTTKDQLPGNSIEFLKWKSDVMDSFRLA